ncbi:MAG: Flp pilus assembly protein CpaB [Omnitrophica WOR_2 bacterium RIFCSPHIGHO2_01_FULL_52_10]|nr:MAG: Flp pilus assembly protein CpaB [Omnitrophica WOR_2 bacterium RIFCSPHIGHO2_01_FULL_52_10]
MNIENKKQIATILLAVGLGLAATFLTSQYVQNNIAQQTKLLAKEYTQQTAALQKEVEINKRQVETLLQKQEMLARQVQSQPKVVVQGDKGQQQLVSQEAFSIVMPPGKRAVTIQVDTLSAVGGLISPGDFVDVIASLRVPEEINAEKAKTKEVITVLFQNLQVLAVGVLFKPAGGTELYENRQKSKSVNVTLAVSPEEAALLTFAETNGKLQLSLRSPAEQDRQLLQVASWDTLADYILDKQGTDLRVPTESPEEPLAPAQKSEEKKERTPKSNIQIFRAGKEL